MTFPTFQKTLLATAVLGLAAAAHAQSPVKFNGDANMEFDTTWKNNNAGWSQGGRVEVNLAGKSTTSDAFVASRASFLAKPDNSVAVDDVWIQFGTSAGDLKLGRFEAADLYPQGRDTLIERAGAGAYRANWMRGRYGNGILHMAGNVNFGGGMGLEVGLSETHDPSKLGGPVNDSNDIGSANAKGIRPVLYYSAGGFSFKGGIEYGKTAKLEGGDLGWSDFLGFGITGGFKLGGGDVNVNFASGEVEDVIQGWTVGANWSVPLGPWVFLEYAENNPNSKNGVIGTLDTEKITTLGLGWQFPLLGIKDATITPAVSYSKADNHLIRNEEEQAFRVRLNYTFAAF